VIWRVIAFVLAVVLPNMAAADFWPGFYRVVNVASDDQLNIRTGPSAGADLNGGYAPGETMIEVTGLDETRRWARVNLREQTGWVALRYLERQSTATEGFDQPLFCYGNEPFWSIDLRPGGLSQFEVFGVAVETFATNASVPTQGNMCRGAITGQGIQRGGFVAMLSLEDCHDGMSDRSFGIRVDVLLDQGNQSALYSGCCALSQ
jgi:uncharacterized membrane protein